MSHSTLKSFKNDGASQPPASATEPVPATVTVTDPAPAPPTEPAPAPECVAAAELPAWRLLRLLSGKMVARAIGVAAELGLADHLRRGPLDHEALARLSGTNPAALYRLLRALAAVGVFDEQPGCRFANNELSAALSSDVRGSLRDTARLLAGDESWAAWGALGHSLRAGEAGFDAVFGADLGTWLGQNPSSQGTFRRALGELGDAAACAVAEAYDFSALETLVEVGGGDARLLGAILRRHARLRGVLIDLPERIAGAKRAADESCLSGRLTALGGDFFAGVPSGADAYIMQPLSHGWADEPWIELLRHCRRSMAAGGRVLVVDPVLGDGPDAALGALLDLERLVVTGGRGRTERELGALLGRAGLRLARVVPTGAPVSLVEAVAG